jgi:hypothetical protein
MHSMHEWGGMSAVAEGLENAAVNPRSPRILLSYHAVLLHTSALLDSAFCEPVDLHRCDSKSNTQTLRSTGRSDQLPLTSRR